GGAQRDPGRTGRAARRVGALRDGSAAGPLTSDVEALPLRLRPDVLAARVGRAEAAAGSGFRARVVRMRFQGRDLDGHPVVQGERAQRVAAEGGWGVASPEADAAQPTDRAPQAAEVAGGGQL